MKTFVLDGNIICYDEYNLNKHIELKELLEEAKLKLFFSNISEKIVLVLGGDGTILKAIQDNYEKKLPFLGINFGTKGFLLNDRKFINIENNSFITREYPLLEVKENSILKGVALNEVNIYSPEGKLVNINIRLSNKQNIDIKGDGVIVSTPIGSTGHNKSYSGNILPHSSPNIVITSKGTLNPDSSKIIEGNSSIFIENLGRKNIIGVNTDGNILFSGKDISIEIVKSHKKVKLLILESYLNIWDNKVLGEQGFNL